MTASSVTQDKPLGDVMLAMDVVDTLRHRARIVERALNEEGQEAALLERLRDIYTAQGIDVPDHILREGVDALREDRFTYVPTPPSLQRKLATIYANRAQWGKSAFIGGTLLLGAWMAWQILVVAPQAREAEEITYALEESLPAQIEKLTGRITAISQNEQVTLQAYNIAEQARDAITDRNIVNAREQLATLSDIAEQLQQSYKLRVVSRPGQLSGIWRIPENNPKSRNYYVIVEAVTHNGKIISVPVTSEEDGRYQKANTFGLRVTRSIFEQVQADKQDDGIIQSNIIGEKRRGVLEPDYYVPVMGGIITEW